MGILAQGNARKPVTMKWRISSNEKHLSILGNWIHHRKIFTNLSKAIPPLDIYILLSYTHTHIHTTHRLCPRLSKRRPFCVDSYQMQLHHWANGSSALLLIFVYLILSQLGEKRYKDSGACCSVSSWGSCWTSCLCLFFSFNWVLGLVDSTLFGFRLLVEIFV